MCFFTLYLCHIPIFKENRAIAQMASRLWHDTKYELCGVAVAAILQKTNDKKIKKADPSASGKEIAEIARTCL